MPIRCRAGTDLSDVPGRTGSEPLPCRRARPPPTAASGNPGPGGGLPRLPDPGHSRTGPPASDRGRSARAVGRRAPIADGAR
ncbi:Hypothetical protein SCLAV_0030 [Streptomyces clavuligerus]|uniref:Uncharacterized protein n=1 Tax=Streptomyces clavuligerus TaxID=1901 RepID=E2Q5U6_STRCL|nr:Hypothetical protein SCLAV_0030 [Streptomyces clavuligerus]